MRTSPLRWLPLLLLSFVVLGCFDISEDFWINGDGTARIRFDVGMSKSLASLTSSDSSKSDDSPSAQFLKMKEELTKDTMVSNVTTGDTTIGEYSHTFIEVSLKSVDAMMRVHDQLLRDTSEGEAKIRPAKLAVTRQGTKVTVQIGLSSDSTPKPENHDTSGLGQMSEQLMTSMFGDAAITYRVHGPHVASPDGTIDSAKTTVTWKFPLAKLSSIKSQVLTADVELPPPPAPPAPGGPSIYIGIAALIIIVFLTMMLMRRRKKAA